MANAPKILAFAGSLRAQSWNKKMVKIAVAGATAAGVECTYIDLRDYALPIFDEDLEKQDGLPANARKLKDLFLAHQGLLIAAPEYNSGITAVLKNTIDWISRPVPGETPLQCYDGKVATLMSASPGALGGLRGLVGVRSILGNIKVTVLPDQVAIGKAHEMFTEDGQLKDAAQKASVEKLGAGLAAMLKKLYA